MILTIAITIIGMIGKIGRIGATWWSTIEVIVLTTSNGPETSEIIGSGATSIRIAKRDAKRDRGRVFLMEGRRMIDVSPTALAPPDLIREIPTGNALGQVNS